MGNIAAAAVLAAVVIVIVFIEWTFRRVVGCFKPQPVTLNFAPWNDYGYPERSAA